MSQFPDLCVLCLTAINNYVDAFLYAQTHLDVAEPDLPARLGIAKIGVSKSPVYTEQKDERGAITMVLGKTQTLREANEWRRVLAEIRARGVDFTLRVDGKVAQYVPDPERIPGKDEVRNVLYDVLKLRAAGHYKQ